MDQGSVIFIKTCFTLSAKMNVMLGMFQRRTGLRHYRWACGERGDVLFEYVLLTVLIILPLIGAATAFFNPSGSTFMVEGALSGEDFGTFGNAFVQLYRLVMSGVCLPLP